MRPRSAPANGLDEVVRACAALTERFGDRLPPHAAQDLPTLAAWWSIALYVRLPAMSSARRFVEADWRAASRAVAAQIVARLVPEEFLDPSEGAMLRDALQAHVFNFCRLWIAAFGFAPTPDRLRDPDAVSESLSALIKKDGLELREQFGLSDDPEGEEERVALCSAFALFFDFCSRSEGP